MDLHRNWKPYARGPALLALALVLAFSPQILAAMGREFVFGDWVGYLLALFGLIGGISAVRESRRAFAVRIGEQGVTWVNGPTTVVFPWAEVSRVSVEKRPNSGRLNRPSLLTVWTTDTVERALPAAVTLTGLRGYQVADLHTVREPADQVVTALRQYGGDRYPATVN
ncbi:hypothetical protein FXF53_09480 [Micromonospora sp. WP24]|uniref:hypothetical protein n=1 Tax=Micromonospora sp. WP24 TaxID=2604469 RepID=UPI0011D9A6EB|nr:hypothetical protein [Micromonospora sp. WP24]TYC02642.1 hypothetical protein FXF53_09480 [Micromonospora sp. WP24]